MEPYGSEKGKECICTFVGAVVILRAFFDAHPEARVVLNMYGTRCRC